MLPPEEILTGVRWRVIEALAHHGEATATELAKRAATTLPSVSQAMKLLEAYGYVAVKKRKRAGPGKPTLLYALKKGLALITFFREGLAGKSTVTLDNIHKAILNIWFLPAVRDHYCLMRLLFDEEKMLDLCEAVAFLRSDEKEIHLLVISEKVEKIRKEFANITVACADGRRKIVTWSHDTAEAVDGLRRKEQYFLDLFKKPHILFDRGGAIKSILAAAGEPGEPGE